MSIEEIREQLKKVRLLSIIATVLDGIIGGIIIVLLIGATVFLGFLGDKLDYLDKYKGNLLTALYSLFSSLGFVILVLFVVVLLFFLAIVLVPFISGIVANRKFDIRLNENPLKLVQGYRVDGILKLIFKLIPFGIGMMGYVGSLVKNGVNMMINDGPIILVFVIMIIISIVEIVLCSKLLKMMSGR